LRTFYLEERACQIRIAALLLAGHPSSIADCQRTDERGHGHLRDISIPALGVVSGY
jgi:hypothetical protein